MALVDGFHHIAFLTADLDRLIAFYERVFDARVIGDREDGGCRHALIALGEHTVLHPFEVPADRVPGRQAMLERGRLDHLAYNAASRDAFLEIRRRLIAEGAHATDDGLVTHMGAGRCGASASTTPTACGAKSCGCLPAQGSTTSSGRPSGR